MIDRLINILQTRTWLHWLLIVLFFFVFSLGMYFPALGKEYLLYGTDTVGHDYVMHLYGWKSILQEGRLPLWNPYIFYGLPFIGTFALCPFYPTQWLYAIFPQNTTFTLQYVLALTVGATCMTIWMRVLGVRLWVAVWAGLALIVSGHFLTLTYAGHLQKMIAIAWAPGAWAACLVLSRRCINASGGYKTPAFMMALCLAMQLLASHAQIFYGTLAVCVLHMGGLSLPLLVKAWTSPEPGIKALIKTTQVVAFSRMVKYLAIAGVLVLLFSSTQMFHSYEISKITNRGNTGLTYEETADTSYPPRELAEYAVAGLWGDSVRDPLTNRAAGTSYSGNWGERIVSDYLGIPILLLVLWTLFIVKGRYRLFLFCLFLISTLLALGSYTPFHKLCYSILPGFARFRSPSTWMFISNFALLGLACFGLNSIINRVVFWSSLREDSSQDSDVVDSSAIKKFARIVLSVGAAIGTAFAIIGFWKNLGVRLDIATANEIGLFKRNQLMFVVGLQVALSGLCMNIALTKLQTVRRLHPNVRKVAKFSGVLLAIIAISVPLLGNRYYVRYDYLERYMDFLNYQKPYAELAKVSDTPKRLIEDRRLKVDQMLHGIASQEGYHPVVLSGYEEMIRVAGFDSERFGQLMGVNFSRTGSGVPLQGSWQPIYTTLRDSVWRWLGTPRPYVHNSPNIILVDDKGSDDIIAHGRVADFALNKNIARKHGLTQGLQNVMGRKVTWNPGNIVLEVETVGTEPSVLPIAEPYAPGWRAQLADGQRVSLVPVNAGMIGIVLPGALAPQIVTVSYDPQSLRIGIFVTWMTILTLLFLQTSRVAALIRRRDSQKDS